MPTENIMLPVIIYISLFLTGIYALLMLLYSTGWHRQEGFSVPVNYRPYISISVIIPARNEADNIARCIESALAQDYPKELYEIIVVDDHSTDDTARIIQTFQGVRYINLADYVDDKEQVTAYKKRALATGIAQSKGDLIVTTDADCTAGSQWLKTIAARYEQEKPVMIVSPVDFTTGKGLAQVFQSLDFMSMQGITAATLQLKLGNMCNGANLAFLKTAYEQVGGYKGIDHIASGDDYLLMMKLAKEFPGSVSYLKSADAIVSTPPQPDWGSFFQQRIRWASKSGKYDDINMTVVLSMVYLFNLCFLFLLLYCIPNPGYWVYLVGMIGLKTVVELIYLYPVAVFFNKTRQLWIFPLLQPLHIIYIISAGLLGFVGVYKWKGRSVK